MILVKTFRSMTDILYFSILLFLFMYISSLLGMEMFAYKLRMKSDDTFVMNVTAAYLRNETMLPSRENFDTISIALTSVFIIIIGEDWPAIMYNYCRLLGNYYCWYFIIVFCFGNFMLLSLFTAILLQNFEEDDSEENEEDDDGVNDKASDSIQTRSTTIYGVRDYKSKFKQMLIEAKY